MVHNIVEEHRNICERSAKLIVHDRSLWSQYQDSAQRVFELRKSQFGPETERATIEAVPGFDERYGLRLTNSRGYVENKIEQDDIYIVHEGKIVAQYIDFIASVPGIGSKTNLYCVGLYPEMYDREIFDAT